jgi:histidyl-tRNA synthetase
MIRDIAKKQEEIMAKVNIARGMRDILPTDMVKRRSVINTIQGVFERFGFAPLETPAVERIETLMGKYGEEGNQLVFKILARGEAGKQGKTDLALRYDLTVPLARVVAMNQQLDFPFKRYQIQPVWRADRPQKGRFREFYQCDVDVVGTKSGLAEAECIAIVHEALVALGFDKFVIRLNDRRILRMIAEEIGAPERETELLVAIDKLDKIQEEGVRTLLVEQKFSAVQIDRLFEILNERKIDGIDSILVELEKIQEWALMMGVSKHRLQIDYTLARGLNYYTGPVFETVLTDTSIGSVSGGGRYDGLIGMFSKKDVPAVGVSLGLERLITIMEERKMFDQKLSGGDVWVTVFSPDLISDSLRLATQLRSAGLKAIVSMRTGKLGKQFRDADKASVRWVVVVGPDDIANKTILLKDLHAGEQKSVAVETAIELISSSK